MRKITLALLGIPCLATANTLYVLPTDLLQSQSVQTQTSHESLTLSKQNLLAEDTQNITQAIAQKDSVQIASSGSGKTISMRGFGANASANTLILYNGIPLSGISLAGTDLGLINTHDIHNIQILPGSAGVRLGNNAVGGVIAINTQLPRHSETQISWTQGWPAYSQLSLSHTQVLDAANRVQVSANTFRDLSRRQNNKQEVAQLGLNIEHQTADNQTHFFIQGGPEKAHYPGALTQAQVNDNRYQGGDYQGRFNDNQILTHLGVEQRINENWSTHLNLSHQQLRGHGTWEYDNASYLENSRSTRLNPSLTWHNQVWSSTIGVSLLRADYFTTGLNDAKQYESDEYLINHLSFSHGWLLSAGGRYVMANQSDQVANDRNHYRSFINTLGLSWQIDPQWYWSIRRAGSFRLPLVDESSFTLPNVSLKPQTGISYETALLFRQNGFRQRLELYQLNLKNEIAFAPSTTGGFARNINLPDTRRQGLILDSHDPITQSLALNASISWMRNQFKATGKMIPWTSPLLLSLGSNWQMSTHWHLFTQAQFTGKRYASSDFENIGGAYGQFLILNTALSYQIKHWDFAVRLNNLLNRRHYDYVSYNSEQTGFYPNEGFNGALTVSYTTV